MGCRSHRILFLTLTLIAMGAGFATYVVGGPAMAAEITPGASQSAPLFFDAGGSLVAVIAALAALFVWFHDLRRQQATRRG